MRDDEPFCLSTTPGKYTWAVVGATGLVGREVLSILEERGVSAGRVRLLASERSAGEVMRFAGEEIVIESVEGASFAGVDAAIFCRSRSNVCAAGDRGWGAGHRQFLCLSAG